MNYKIETLLAFLNDNLHLELSVEEMSLKVGLSPSHFQHLFKEEIKMSPAAYLKELRLEKAAELLTTTFLSVKEVREKVGLRDARHFAADFKQKFDLTPTDYRQKFFQIEQIVREVRNKIAESAHE